MFDFREWRRDLEDAAKAGDLAHVRVLLDRMEREWLDVMDELEALTAYEGGDGNDAP